MSIKIQSICRDTKNFFCNQFTIILIIALLCASITLVLDYILLPNKTQIINFSKEYKHSSIFIFFETLKNMSREQQKILLHASIVASFSNLISNTIMTGSTLLMIQLISNRQHFNILKIISSSMFFLPKLFILILLITVIIQIGITLIIIPGILFSIVLSFSPVLIVSNRMNILSAMSYSIKIAWSNMRLVAPAVINWLLAKILLLIFASYFAVLMPNIDAIITNIMSNIISMILLIYLFRLLMLIHQ